MPIEKLPALKWLCSVLAFGSLCVVLPVLAEEEAAPVAPHPLYGESGSLITHADPDLQRLIVLDAESRKLVFYKISSGGMSVTAVRDLDEDIAGWTEPAPPEQRYKAPVIDVPGEDLPEVPRPPNAVRISYYSDRSRNDRVEHANSYMVQGTLQEIYGWYRNRMDGWIVESDRVDVRAGFHHYASLELTRGSKKLSIGLKDSDRVDGYVVVSMKIVKPVE